jgi:hypothetical protein
MANKWAEEMRKWDNVIKDDYNPFAHGLVSGSPSLNYTFGRSHSLPEGYSLVVFGEPKGGKSVIINSFTGELHKSDPDAISVKFDTELRERLQNATQENTDVTSLFGIDKDRNIVIEDNTPDGVFDTIETKIPAMCDKGAKIKLVAIDSINSIQGVRGMNNTSVTNVTIGDLAQTLQNGFKRILPVQRKYKFAVIVSAQVRAEMDPHEQMRGHKVKMGASYAVQHYAEYFMHVQRILSKEGSKDELGNSFEDESRKDMADKAEKTAHKIRVVMRGNSAVGSAIGRTGEFTFNYKTGIINTHEEVLVLGVNQGIIQKPNLQAYAFGDKQWRGKEAMLIALKEDPALAQQILKKLKDLDMGYKSV